MVVDTVGTVDVSPGLGVCGDAFVDESEELAVGCLGYAGALEGDDTVEEVVVIALAEYAAAEDADMGAVSLEVDGADIADAAVVLLEARCPAAPSH